MVLRPGSELHLFSLGLTGTAEVGSLDQVIDVSDYKGLHRCPVLVCPKSKVKGAKSTYYKFCANPSKFQVNGRHFCGVYKLTFQNHPGALKGVRIFDCETDVVVCSKVHGMGLAYSLQDAHVKDHCERVGQTGNEDGAAVQPRANVQGPRTAINRPGGDPKFWCEDISYG